MSVVAKRSACYLKRIHKFGIEIPRTIKEALDLDRQNGNTFWADAIAKEMTKVQKTFDIGPFCHELFVVLLYGTIFSTSE